MGDGSGCQVERGPFQVPIRVLEIIYIYMYIHIFIYIHTHTPYNPKP